MTYDTTRNRFTVLARINGVGRSMTIASASMLMIDSAFADAAGLKRGKDLGGGSGPTGTHVTDNRLGSPIRVKIGDWTSPPIVDGSIMDSYAYSAMQRPAVADKADGGTLGGAFLISNRAVVDFGSRVLYLPAAR